MDDLSRQAALDQWRAHRNDWAQNERPARSAMKAFENFYELYGRIEREAERVELVLGDGILSWRRQEGGVYHPVLLQRLQLTFSPSIPEFTLAETDQPVELYSALFQSMPDVDGRAIGRWAEASAEFGRPSLARDYSGLEESRHRMARLARIPPGG